MKNEKLIIEYQEPQNTFAVKTNAAFIMLIDRLDKIHFDFDKVKSDQECEALDADFELAEKDLISAYTKFMHTLNKHESLKNDSTRSTDNQIKDHNKKIDDLEKQHRHIL